jgi:hypothetical protein
MLGANSEHVRTNPLVLEAFPRFTDLVIWTSKVEFNGLISAAEALLQSSLVEVVSRKAQKLRFNHVKIILAVLESGRFAPTARISMIDCYSTLVSRQCN